MQKLNPTRIHRRGIYAQLGGNANDFTLHWDGIGTFRCEGGHTLHKTVITENNDLLQLFENSEARAGLAWQQGKFLLHAGAVAVNGKAYVFVGTPGTGKSTTTAAFVQAGYPPLADDIAVIDFIDGKPYVVPTDHKIKIWETSVDSLGIDYKDVTPCVEGHKKYYYEYKGQCPTAPVPLAAIYILHRSNRYPRISSISPIVAPVELIKHFPIPYELLEGMALQQHFQDSIRIAQQADIIKMKRPQGFDKLRTFVGKIASEIIDTKS